MTAVEILEQLESVGAKLISKPPDGKLVITARKGAVTPQLAALVASHKDDLRSLLASAGSAMPMQAGAEPPGHGDDLAREIAELERLFGSTTEQPQPNQAPLLLYPVKVKFGGRQLSLMLVRHCCSGTNRFGQGAAEFPYAALNFAAWKARPFDLARVRWFRSADEVGRISRIEISPAPELEDRRICASFPGDVTIELRLEGRGRWGIWVQASGTRRRRKDFATLYLDHARRCAEHFYGAPIGNWREPSEDTRS